MTETNNEIKEDFHMLLEKCTLLAHLPHNTDWSI